MAHMFKCALLSLIVFSSLVIAADDKVERGKYLTEEIGKCQDCHTPRLETGELDKSKWLKGAPALDFAPKKPVKGWHDSSPDLTGGGRLFQRWNEDGIVKFLVTGKGPRGNGADAPMPTYNMKQEDAEAIVAYLKSLK